MRQLTHSINPANDAIQVQALDAPGHGGASHAYGISIPGVPPSGRLAYEAYSAHTGGVSLVSGATLPTWDGLSDPIRGAWEASAAALHTAHLGHLVLAFQNGPVAADGNGVNGITHEALLAVLIDRLEGFQAGPYASMDNANALSFLRMALAALHNRTRARIARGVEGTHTV